MYVQREIYNHAHLLKKSVISTRKRLNTIHAIDDVFLKKIYALHFPHCSHFQTSAVFYMDSCRQKRPEIHKFTLHENGLNTIP